MFTIDSQSDSESATVDNETGTIVVLNKDIFFGVKIGNTLRSLGYRIVFAKRTEEFAQAVSSEDSHPILAVIDINAGVEWEQISKLTGSTGPGVPVLAFGSHLDVDGLRAAKTAGVRRVVSNGDFHRDMVKLIQRYATTTGAEPLEEDANSPSN